MWVVEFQARDVKKTWCGLYNSLYFTKEKAKAAMVVEIFEDPSVQYRIVEVKDWPYTKSEE